MQLRCHSGNSFECNVSRRLWMKKLP
jgi:hypothetical protein